MSINPILNLLEFGGQHDALCVCKKSTSTGFLTGPSPAMGFSLLPHVLGPGILLNTARNSQKSSGQGGAGET